VRRRLIGLAVPPTCLQWLSAVVCLRYRAGMSVAGGGGVFVSYRREDGGDAAGRLADRLVDRFGAGRVFMDVEAIEPGTDFVEVITRAVEACDVLVVVIGPGWLTATDTRGRRLDDPNDWVRVEVRTALARGARVIPVLVRDAVMPNRGDLPEDLAGLARRAALRVRHESFRDDAARLVAAVAQVLVLAGPAGSTARPPGHPPESAAKTRTGASQDKVALAARLFREAVSITDSIIAGSFKVAALSGVAGAMAAFDPSHAARLSDDSERIANSITDTSEKARALCDVAGGMAATDPGRAERIANSITDASAKARALSDVAVAMAATDPGHAEAIANSITDGVVKVRALNDVAVAAAATDPGHAEAIANSFPADYYWRALVLSAVAAAVAATDGSRAARLFSDAERITNSTPDGVTKALMLSAVAAAVAATDRSRAARLSSDAERITYAVTNDFDKESTLCGMGGGVGVAGAVAAIDPDRAERIANSITRYIYKDIALRKVAEMTAATNPGRAERIANSITLAWVKAPALARIAKALIATMTGRA
jgi:hypothetical protein